jgi:hypothetical protein
MTRTRIAMGGVWLAVAALTVPVLAGQQNLRSTEPQLSAERSWAVQSELAAIDRSREAFVNDLIESWTPYVDKDVYNLWSELKPIAMRAPAWQLLGASKVGDFQTMVAVLRGQTGAAQFINTLDQPQAKAWASSDLLGDTTGSLVFTPIAPCRIVDTRGVGARTGFLNPGVPRTFDLTTDGYGKGQGGQTSGCTGLPSFSHRAFAVNITVAAYAANGGLQVYPSGGAIPATSLINFFPAAYAIANNGPVTGCYGCVDDITINAFGASTHVIIDVMGYYERASVTGASISRIAGTPVNIAAGGRSFATGGACPAGTVMIGGENDYTGTDVSIGESRQATATTWTMWHINNDALARTTTVYSRCLDQPIEVP